jgi:hypothetical protein
VVAVCRRWQRAAAAVARRLGRSRQLAARWRGPAPVDAAQSTSRAGGSTATLLIFSVPLVSAEGEVLERHAVAVRVPGLSRSAPKGVRTAVLEAARERAAARLRARAARLTRLRTALAARDADVEARITSRLVDAHVPREVQTGLFDRRGARAFAAARADKRAIAAVAEERGRRRGDRAVQPGRPALAIAFLAP